MKQLDSQELLEKLKKIEKEEMSPCFTDFDKAITWLNSQEDEVK